jgi:hypothetical protein
MRQVASISLFLILAFNWLGYDIVVAVLNARAHYTAQKSIDSRQYDPSRLIEIKVPLDLPYSTDWASFEQVKGVISFEGVLYNFVERKYENGQMTYRCLPNQRGTEIQNARDYFYSLVYDLDKQEKGDSAPKQHASKKLNIETTVEPIGLDADLSIQSTIERGRLLSMSMMDGHANLPLQPPEA